MNISLVGKHALVCGSTQGIGRAAAHALASLGARVTLIARNEEALKAAVSTLPALEGQHHAHIVADFSDTASVRKAVHAFMKANAPVHILVNNSGGPKPGEAISAGTDDFERAFAHHLINNQTLVQAVVDGMREAKYGRVINVISTSVREPIRGLGVSNTIRAAVAGWAKTLSVELAPFGITVNNVLPGATRTARLESLLVSKAAKARVSEADIEKEMLAEIPAGRFASPDEIGDVIAFLASPAAGYINGVSLAVDGGRMRSL